jgi:hypothetical protein
MLGSKLSLKLSENAPFRRLPPKNGFRGCPEACFDIGGAVLIWPIWRAKFPDEPQAPEFSLWMKS